MYCMSSHVVMSKKLKLKQHFIKQHSAFISSALKLSGQAQQTQDVQEVQEFISWVIFGHFVCYNVQDLCGNRD